jgi:argininosuccinate synthase
MPVDVKGRIVYNPDNEQEYSIDCKQLSISDEGSGSIEDDIEDLRERVTKAISEEFHVAPSAITITGYVMSLNFSIEGPTNHTLDKFCEEKDKEPAE